MSHDEVTVLTPSVLRAWALPTPSGDKSSRGTVLVVGGSRMTPGAVLLAGKAALRAGAGKLQLATAESAAPALGIAVPEAMVASLPENAGGAVAELPSSVAGLAQDADVVLVGPGLMAGEETAKLMRVLISSLAEDARLVVDANALLALAESSDQVRRRRPPVVLTPNLAEGAALRGRELTDDLDQEAGVLANDLGCVVSLFGHVADVNGSRWRDETADSGLGTSGSGDVAAGIVAGILARGAEPAQAAAWATYVHAASGQRLALGHGRSGYLASDLVEEISSTLLTLEA